MCAPAMKGLSSTGFEKHTSFAQPRPPSSAVSFAVSRTTWANFAVASMLIPAFVVARETLEQTRAVSARAWGIEFSSASSARVKPLWT